MRAFFALLLALLIGPAAAQVTPGNQPLSIAKGGTSAGTRTGAFSALAPAPTRAGDISYWNGSAWVTVPGNNSGTQILTENASGVPGWSTPGGTGTVTSLTPGDQITMTPNPITSSGSVRLTAGAANTIKGSVNGTTTSDLAISSCSALYNFTQWVSGSGWQCGINPVLPSRAVAATLNLSAFTSVKTLGYATPGDGGEATFKNVTTNPVIDSYITSFTITAGSGYTNGSFFGVQWQVGSKPTSIGTATVAGGVVTAVNIAATPGNLCKVGDVLTTGSLAAGTGASITVTGCSTSLASFTDTASNHWQFTPGAGTYPNILQFGCVGDFNGVDASATDNFACLQAASWTAAFKSAAPTGAGGFWGGRVLIPQGAFMAGCSGTSSLVIGEGVIFDGSSDQGSIIKLCNTFSATTHFIELCDPLWHFSCFSTKLMNLALVADRTVSTAGGAVMVHSNNVQDFGGLDHVYIYSGQRGCTHFEHGYGGASTVSVQYVSCNGASTTTFMMKFGNTVGSGLAYGTTIFEIQDLVLGGPSSCSPTCQTSPGLLLQGGGFYHISGVHCENAGTVCITVDIPVTGNSDTVWLNNVNAGWGAPATACTGNIFLTAANNPGNTIMSMIPAGSCAQTVTNGQSGGVSWTSSIRGPLMCVSGACAAAVP